MIIFKKKKYGFIFDGQFGVTEDKNLLNEMIKTENERSRIMQKLHKEYIKQFCTFNSDGNRISDGRHISELIEERKKLKKFYGININK
jgi:hypothetical protein